MSVIVLEVLRQTGLKSSANGTRDVLGFHTGNVARMAKDFGVKLPSARYLEVATSAGDALKVKAATLCPELKGKLDTAKSVILWEYMPGDILGYFKNKGFSDEKVEELQKNTESFVKIGKMLVFDAAILNTDRFKVESGAEANSGNMMLVNSEPVGLDQEFGKADPLSTIGENFSEGSSDYFASKLGPLLSNPDVLAEVLVKKMVGEGYIVFTGQSAPIAEGIKAGMEILKRLADRKNPRVEQLVEWSKTFKPDSDLEPDAVRKYWASILG